jgi:hypothetical protein
MNAFTIQWLDCVLHLGSLEEPKAVPALRRTWTSELVAGRGSVIAECYPLSDPLNRPNERN